MTSDDRVLCISDLHLSPERPDIFRAFSEFLETTAKTAHSLYILGDFFNLWIGDDDTAEFPVQVSRQLRSLADKGIEVYVMHGNRDFLLGKVFCEASGATLIHEPYPLSCFNSNFLLLHGDSLCTKDTDYMAFRTMVRDPQWQQTFLDKSLEERQEFANEARAKSKAMSSNKAEDIMDVTQEEVVRLMAETGHSTLVHGHTHRPAIHEVDLEGKPGKRIVLGDWDKRGWFLEITPEGYSLENFPI